MAGRIYVLKLKPGEDAKVLPDKTQILRVDSSEINEPGVYYAVVVEAVESMIATPKSMVSK